MQHLRRGRKFGRERNQRKALMKNLASSFFVSGRIQTTEAKAKELRPWAEKFITRAKTPTVTNRRILARLFSPAAVKKVMESAAEFKDRPGGYTRIIKTGTRKSDGARMAILEFVK